MLAQITSVTLPARPGPTTRVVVPLPRLSPGIRQFLATEAGSATLLLAAAVVALVWANVPGWATYESVWSTMASIRVGDWTFALDLRHWINDAAMAIFFLVVGLEISRELTSETCAAFVRSLHPRSAPSADWLCPP